MDGGRRGGVQMRRMSQSRSTRKRTVDACRASSIPSGWVHDTTEMVKQARTARIAFRRSVAGGECGLDVLHAALQAEAEDDARVSTSAVRFPVSAFEKRVTRIADDILKLPGCSVHGLTTSEDRTARTKRIVDATRMYLFERMRFRLSASSSVEDAVVYEHPGVYVQPATIYVSRVLISKEGSAPALAIVLDAVLKRIFLRRAEAGDKSLLAVRVESNNHSLPTCTIMSISAMAPSLVNVTPVDVIVQQQLLKVSFWPFQWDSSGGRRTSLMQSFGTGFEDAARAAILRLQKKSQRAYIDAVSRAAAHRLRRGIWTTTGGGDINRCITACERLCTVVDECETDALGAFDRLVAHRDLAVLYFHDGRWKECRSMLKRCIAGDTDAAVAGDDSDSKIASELLRALEDDDNDVGNDGDGMARITELPW